MRDAHNSLAVTHTLYGFTKFAPPLASRSWLMWTVFPSCREGLGVAAIARARAGAHDDDGRRDALGGRVAHAGGHLRIARVDRRAVRRDDRSR